MLKALRGLAIAAAALSAGSASAQSIEEFYKGRQIQVIIYSPAGSTYDLYARFLTQYMGKYIPGNPIFVPRNMVGAGGLQAASYLFRIAPKDGATFGTIARNIPFEPMLGKNDVNIDPLAYTWIGSMNRDRSIALSWHTSKVKTLADLQKMELLVPGTGAGADSEVMPIAFNTLFGTKFNVVKGYKSTGDSTLAVERGEIDGIAYWSWSAIQSSHKRWLDNKQVNVLFHTGLDGDPEIPAPSIRTLVRNETERAALDFILAREFIGRPFLAPPGIPEDRAKALRDAFNSTMTDPEFIAEAKKRNIEIQLVTGEQVMDVLKKAAAAPPAVIDRVNKALER